MKSIFIFCIIWRQVVKKAVTSTLLPQALYLPQGCNIRKGANRSGLFCNGWRLMSFCDSLAYLRFQHCLLWGVWMCASGLASGTALGWPGFRTVSFPEVFGGGFFSCVALPVGVLQDHISCLFYATDEFNLWEHGVNDSNDRKCGVITVPLLPSPP